jgi:hypothetical protein
VRAAEDAAAAPVASVEASYAGDPGVEAQRLADLLEERYEGDGAAEADEMYPLAARITGLAPDATYCYRLETDQGALTDWGTLRTAPPASTTRPLRFVALGDSGAGTAAQLAVAKRLGTVPFEAMLFLGDIAYPRGSYDQLQTRFFEVYAPYLARAPAYAAIGNHETWTDGGAPFDDVFVLPGNERWYSFDWGHVHFVFIDTNRIASDSLAWLERDLAGRDPRTRWTIVVGHHPPFSAAQRGPVHALRTRLVPILERHRVDLVLNGHEHHYERTLPIRGVTYVTSGGGGGSLTPPGVTRDTRYTEEVHHFLAIEVTRTRLSLRAIDVEERLVDELELTRPPDAPGAG